jgi:hypothetical protein
LKEEFTEENKMKAQGIEGKATGKEAERFICLGRDKIVEFYPKGTVPFIIPNGAKWVKARRNKIGFYSGTKPVENGYTRIPENVNFAELPEYTKHRHHIHYGRFEFY